MQTAPPKVLASKSYDKFSKDTKISIFGGSSKGGPRENGSKGRPTLGVPKSPRRKSGYLLISMRSSPIIGEHFCANRSLKSPKKSDL